MLRILRTRFKQGHRTTRFPLEIPALPARFHGRLAVEPGKCLADCAKCHDACPTGAITTDGGLKLDMGKCLFCSACVEACPTGAVSYTTDHRLATSTRQDLVLSGQELKLAAGMGDEIFRIMGRALRLRQVCAGGCNACELDINVLNTVGWDLSRFGIQFVASPRHADGLVVTGPVTRNMHYALMNTYQATPRPRVVIAVGACAISGGPYRDSAAVHNGVEGILPVDLYIPGCPPHPLTILDGLVRFIRQMPKEDKAS